MDEMGNKASKYVCVARDKAGNNACKHYPHTSIPAGQEAWVMLTVYGTGALTAYHKDCVTGLWYLTFDGVQTSPYFLDQSSALEWLIRQASGGNVDDKREWQLKRAHGEEIVEVLSEWARLQTLYAKAADLKERDELTEGDEIEADANETCKDLMTRLVDALQVG